MASLLITNVSSLPVTLADFYSTVPVGGSITVTRAASDIPRLASLMHALALSQVSLAVTWSSDEAASGLQTPPNAVQAIDMAAVTATGLAAPIVSFFGAVPAGIGGAADDVTIAAVGTMPFKFRVLNAWFLCSTAVGASTIDLRTAAAGAGTLLATVSSGATGYSPMTAPNATTVVTPGTAVGLFARRSNNTVAGEFVILARIES